MRRVLFIVLVLLLPISAFAVDTIRYVDTDCANNGDGTSSSCAASPGAAGAYSNVSNAADDIDADFSDITAAGSNTSIIIKAAGTAVDSSSPVFQGIITDDTHYVELACDSGKGDGCRAVNTNYSSSYYRIENTQYYGVIVDLLGNLRVTNTQGFSKCNDDCSGSFIAWRGSACGTLRVSRNIAHYQAGTTPTTASGNWAIQSVSNSCTGAKSMYIDNNIFYDFRRGGIQCSTNTTTGTVCAIHNNTIADADYAGASCILIDAYGTGETASIYNNIMQNCAGDDYAVDPTPATYNHADNITEDATSPDTSGCEGGGTCRSRAVTFNNEAGDDFHLAAGDTHAKDLGTDLSANGTLSFSNDFDSQTRSGSWDIGADEIVSSSAGRRRGAELGGGMQSLSGGM